MTRNLGEGNTQLLVGRGGSFGIPAGLVWTGGVVVVLALLFRLAVIGLVIIGFRSAAVGLTRFRKWLSILIAALGLV